MAGGLATGQSQRRRPVPAVIADDEAWRLLALSGGTPLALFGEWEPGRNWGAGACSAPGSRLRKPGLVSGRTKERCDEQRQFWAALQQSSLVGADRLAVPAVLTAQVDAQPAPGRKPCKPPGCSRLHQRLPSC
jgi:hypothetical protein